MTNLTLDRVIEIYSYKYKDVYYEIHVDATAERYVLEIFSEKECNVEDATLFSYFNALVKQLV